jgi:hypothetical protein
MVFTRLAAAAALSALVLGASATSASAHYDRHWHAGPLGVVGAVVGGAVAIATAPLVIVGTALSGGYEERGPRYAPGYGYPPRAGYYYGPGPRYYGPRRFYGRPRRYYRPY